MNKLVLFNSVIDIFSTFLVFLIGTIIIIRIRGLFNASQFRVVCLYIWHTIFSIVFAYLSTLKGADSISYYLKSFEQQQLGEFRLGTMAIIHFTVIFSQGFGLSYLGVFFVFNIFGVIGLIAVDAALRWAKV